MLHLLWCWTSRKRIESSTYWYNMNQFNLHFFCYIHFSNEFKTKIQLYFVHVSLFNIPMVYRWKKNRIKEIHNIIVFGINKCQMTTLWAIFLTSPPIPVTLFIAKNKEFIENFYFKSCLLRCSKIIAPELVQLIGLCDQNIETRINTAQIRVETKWNGEKKTKPNWKTHLVEKDVLLILISHFRFTQKIKISRNSVRSQPMSLKSFYNYTKQKEKDVHLLSVSNSF